MPPLPKKKHTKHRIGNRRAAQKLNVPGFVECPRCHSPKMPHRVCPSCGTYKGRDILYLEETS